GEQNGRRDGERNALKSYFEFLRASQPSACGLPATTLSFFMPPMREGGCRENTLSAQWEAQNECAIRFYHPEQSQRHSVRPYLAGRPSMVSETKGASSISGPGGQ